MAFPLVGIITGLFNVGSKMFSSWQERKKIEAQGKIDITKARVEGAIEKAQTQTEGNVQYDIEAQKGMQSSWKDEYLVIVFSIPAIMCFIPGLVGYVERGFLALQKTPVWYQWALIAIVTAVFGVRSIAENILNRFKR